MNTADLIDIIADCARSHADVTSVEHYGIDTDLDGFTVKAEGETYEVTVTHV